MLGARSISEGIDLIKRELVLGEDLAEVRARMLIVNSADDRAIPASEGEKIKEGAINSEVELVLFPGRAHGGPTALAIPLEADWLAETLGSA